MVTWDHLGLRRAFKNGDVDYNTTIFLISAIIQSSVLIQFSMIFHSSDFFWYNYAALDGVSCFFQLQKSKDLSLFEVLTSKKKIVLNDRIKLFYGFSSTNGTCILKCIRLCTILCTVLRLKLVPKQIYWTSFSFFLNATEKEINDFQKREINAFSETKTCCTWLYPASLPFHLDAFYFPEILLEVFMTQ